MPTKALGNGAKDRTTYVTIPEEFDLSRYDDLRHVPDRILGGLLEHRRQLWFGCLHNSNPTAEQKAQMIRAVEKLLMSPLEGRAFHPATRNVDRIGGGLVSEPTVGDLMRRLEAFQDFKGAAAQANHELVFPPSDPEGRYFDTISPNHMRTIYPEQFKSPDFLVKVNLDARDDELIRSFKQFLLDLRELRGFPQPEEIETERSEMTKRKIIQYRSIPYIDLKIWCLTQNAKIKTAELAKIFFPHLDQTTTGQRHIREEAEKYAEKALNFAFVQSLQSRKTT
ncbi:MAG: DUF6387 family protein [Pseudomonas sp.]